MLNTEANKLYENLAFTHKVHEKQCELLSAWIVVLRLVSIGGIVVVLLLQFWQLTDPMNRNLITWSIYLTTFEVGLLAYQLNFNYEKGYEQHRSAAKRAVTLKNELLLIKDDPALDRKTLKVIVNRINELYQAAPQTNLVAKVLAEIKWLP